MPSTIKTALLVSLLPFLGVQATRYRGKASHHQAMLGSSLMQVDSTGQQDDTSSGCSDDGSGNAGSHSGCNDCGISDFRDTTGSGSPLVTDCQAMLQKIVRDQEWIVNTEGVLIVSYGSCAFWAKSEGPDFSKIGNADLLDLVTDSISKYAKDGRVGCMGGYAMYVGAQGTMPCDNLQPGGQQVRVDWTLGATPQQSNQPQGSPDQDHPQQGSPDQDHPQQDDNGWGVEQSDASSPVRGGAKPPSN